MERNKIAITSFLSILCLLLSHFAVAQCQHHGLHICRHNGHRTRVIYTNDSCGHGCNSHSCSHQNQHQERKSPKEDAKLGLKGGFSSANFYQSESDISDRSLRRGYHFGITGRFPIVPKLIAVHADILYSQKGVSGSLPSLNSPATFKLKYVDIPMMLAFDIARGFSVEGGVYGSYLMKGEGSFKDNTMGSFGTGDFNTFDYGYVAGVGFRSNGVGFGARYNHGLRQIAASSRLDGHIADAKNASLQLYLVLGL